MRLQLVTGSALLGTYGAPEAMTALAQRVFETPGRTVLAAMARSTPGVALTNHPLFKPWLETQTEDSLGLALPSEMALQLAAFQTAGVADDVIANVLDNQRWVMLLSELGIPPESHALTRQGIEQLGADVDLDLLGELIKHDVKLEHYPVYAALKARGFINVEESIAVATSFIKGVESIEAAVQDIKAFFDLIDAHTGLRSELGIRILTWIDYFCESAFDFGTAISKAQEWGNVQVYTPGLFNLMGLKADAKVAPLLEKLNTLILMAEAMFAHEESQMALQRAIGRLLPDFAQVVELLSSTSISRERKLDLEDAIEDVMLHIDGFIGGSISVETVDQQSRYVRLLERKVKALGDSQ